jgi:hypothetical protein
MKYKKTTAIGNAGEYYFAYWISKNFQWPCRLLDIDIGIDAQVEILDDENRTTGDFLAIQIKTSENENINKSIPLTNLEYWKSIQDVVMLVSINLSSLEIYWKLVNDRNIDELIIYAQNNGNDTVTIQFDANDLLSKEDKSAFRKLKFKDHIVKVNETIENFLEKCIEINTECWNEEYDHYEYPSWADIIYFESTIETYDSLCNIYDEIQHIIDSISGLEQHLEIDELEEKFSKTGEIVASMIDEICRDPEYRYEYKERYQSTEYNKGHL